MKKLVFAATALVLAPLSIAAAQAGTGTAGTNAPGNQTGAVEASGKVGGTGGALPNTAARLDSAKRSGASDSTRRSRAYRARRNRGAAHRDSAAALVPNPAAGSTSSGGGSTSSGTPPRR